MKKMILGLIIAIFMIFQSSSLQAEELTKEQILAMLPKYLGTNNSGTEFVMTFHPCWEETSKNNEIKVYISSGKATNVTLTIPGLNYQESQVTIPNGIIEFSLSPTIAQMYSKDVSEPPQPEQIWQGRAIILTADDPIIAYGVTRYRYTSDGYLAIPITGLGKEYQVSSYEDPSTDASGQYLTSYTSIVAAYDNTEVNVIFGGSQSTWIPSTGGEIFNVGDDTTKIMNKGDVWLIPARGNYGDLSGTMVNASKPVAVISGSFCSYIPRGVAACDFIISQELPKSTWGKKYHVTQIIDRKKSSMVKLFAKENNTQLFKEGEPWGTFGEVGVEENKGFYKRRLLSVDDPQLRPVTISADKPISITQFNPGQNDDNIESDPFQMVLTPIEQYQTEIIFNTPGINGGASFKRNYLNVVYLASENGEIPNDLEWAQVVNGEFTWKKVSDFAGGPGKKLIDPDFSENQRQYYAKPILLPDSAGVYKFRANDPFAAYAYGFDLYDSYGYPTSGNLVDLEMKEKDNEKPALQLTVLNDGNISGSIFDEPIDEPENRSNISSVILLKEYSENYEWKTEPEVISGETYLANCELQLIDKSKPGKAVIFVSDKVGNKDVFIYSFEKPIIDITNAIENWGLMKTSDSPISKTFNLKNNGAADLNFDEFQIILQSVENNDINQGFSVNDYNLESPLSAGEDYDFSISFNPEIGEGVWRDSIGYKVMLNGEVILQEYKSEVLASVGEPIIFVSDIDFGLKTANDETIERSFEVANYGTVDLIITGYQWANLKRNDGLNVFELDADLANVSESSPLVIAPGNTKDFTVKFFPDESKTYSDNLIFNSNASTADSICILNGIGKGKSIASLQYDWGTKRTNLGKYANSQYIDLTYYESSEGAITITNNGSEDEEITNVSINKDEFGGSFVDVTEKKVLNEIDNLQKLFIGKSIPSGSTLIIPVSYFPTNSGNHNLSLNFETDKETKFNVSLAGKAIYPKITAEDIDFTPDKPYNDIENAMVKNLVISCQNWEYEDTVRIYDLQSKYPDEISFESNNFGTMGLMIDKSKIKFPIIIAPGEDYELPVWFHAQSTGLYKAELVTISDAENEISAELKGAFFTSVNEDVEFSVNITPNPATDKLKIELLNAKMQSIEIRDMKGKLIMNEEIHLMTSSHQMNIDALTNGTYFITVTTQSGTYTEKFVKVK